MLSRRDVVGKLAAGTAALCVAGAARAGSAATRPQEAGATGDSHAPADGPALHTNQPLVDAEPPATLSAPPPWELLYPLALGSAVAQGWRVAGLSGVVDGSCVLTLENARGRTQRVHLCRHAGTPQGLVYTQRFDLVVMNGGQGDLPTEESCAQAVAAVAHVLAANEDAARHAPVVGALLPHAERVRQFASAAKLR